MKIFLLIIFFSNQIVYGQFSDQTSSIAQERVLIETDQQMNKYGNKSNTGMMPLEFNKRTNSSRTDCSTPVFGYPTDLANNILWNVKQGDIIGTWMVAPYSGTIDTVYFLVGPQIGAADSLVEVKFWPSNIRPNRGPGISPYPSACTPWGYYYSQYLNKVVPLQQDLYPTDDTSWHSTVPVEEKSFPPFSFNPWEEIHYFVKIKSGINYLDMGLFGGTHVAKGQAFFILIKPMESEPPSPNSTTSFFASHNETLPDSIPALTWIFYQNAVPGWPNCDSSSGLPSGWYARSNDQPIIWYSLSPEENFAPIINPVPNGDASNTFSTNSMPIEYEIYDCIPENPAPAGGVSAFIRWWKSSGIDFLQQPDIVMSQTGIGDNWNAEIPGQEPGTTLRYQIVARDSAELESTSPIRTYKIVTLKNYYYWIDTSCAYASKSISESGTIVPYTSFFPTPYHDSYLNARDDGTAGPFYLGSPFQFFGDTTIRYAWIGVNGAMALSKSATDTIDVNSNGMFSSDIENYYNYWDIPMPQHAGRWDTMGRKNMPPNFVAPLWADFVLATEGSTPSLFGNIRFGNGLDSCQFIVEWDSLAIYNPNGNEIIPDVASFRVILNRCDQSIEYQYDNTGMHGLDTVALVGMQQDSSEVSGSEPGYIFLNKNGLPPETKIRSNWCIKFYAGAPLYVKDGWHLLSVSFTRPDEMKTDEAYNSNKCPFKYIAGYVEYCDSVLSPGLGFWLRFNKYSIAGAPGLPISDLTISLRAGWNMVGGISKPVSTSSIEKSSGLVISPFFKYNGQYEISAIVEPGNGYWVRTNQAGTLHLQSSGSFVKPSEPDYSKLHKITLRNNDGWSQSLYIGSDDAIKQSQLTIDELPPPALFFDARFEETQSMIASYPDKMREGIIYNFPISLYSGSYPITIEWEMNQENGKNYSLKIDDKTECILAGNGSRSFPKISKLSVLINNKMSLPRDFALDQNYPNPFNPSTEIKYALPIACHVTLKIFNLLGQEVVTLVDEVKPAGDYSVIWDINASGTRLASGIYLCKIAANEYSAHHKIILIK